MRKCREPKKYDQEKTEKAFIMICELMEFNPQIETTLWLSASASIFSCILHNSGFNRKEFCEEIDTIKNHFKERFPDDN